MTPMDMLNAIASSETSNSQAATTTAGLINTFAQAGITSTKANLANAASVITALSPPAGTTWPAGSAQANALAAALQVQGTLNSLLASYQALIPAPAAAPAATTTGP